jgi:hypothetical protein
MGVKKFWAFWYWSRVGAENAGEIDNNKRIAAKPTKALLILSSFQDSTFAGQQTLQLPPSAKR